MNIPKSFKPIKKIYIEGEFLTLEEQDNPFKVPDCQTSLYFPDFNLLMKANFAINPRKPQDSIITVFDISSQKVLSNQILYFIFCVISIDLIMFYCSNFETLSKSKTPLPRFGDYLFAFETRIPGENLLAGFE